MGGGVWGGGGSSKVFMRKKRKEIIKLSKLTEVSVYPKPVERQKVTHCLKIFSDETVAALKTNRYLPTSDTYETAIFIEKVLPFW